MSSPGARASCSAGSPRASSTSGSAASTPWRTPRGRSKTWQAAAPPASSCSSPSGDGAGGGLVAGYQLLADGFQVGQRSGGGVGGGGDRHGDAGQDVVSARDGQRQDVAETGGGAVPRGQGRQ